MRKVNFKSWVMGSDGKSGYYETRQGLFHQWGIEADGEGQANTVGIIETDGGWIHTPVAIHVTFIDPPPNDEVLVVSGNIQANSTILSDSAKAAVKEDDEKYCDQLR